MELQVLKFDPFAHVVRRRKHRAPTHQKTPPEKPSHHQISRCPSIYTKKLRQSASSDITSDGNTHGNAFKFGYPKTKTTSTGASSTKHLPVATKVAPTKKESLQTSMRNEIVKLQLSNTCEREMSIIIAAIWSRSRKSGIASLILIRYASLAIMGYAINVYMAANRHRYVHDTRASDPSFQRRMRVFIDDIETDLMYCRETLELNIAKLPRADLVQCSNDLRTEFESYIEPRDYDSSLWQIPFVCAAIRAILISELMEPQSSDLTPLGDEYRARKHEIYSILVCQSQNNVHAYTHEPEARKTSRLNASDKWYDLWDFMCAEATDQTYPYHFRVMGDLLRVITCAFVRKNNSPSGIVTDMVER
ncbi:hypothetical protein JCM33374_g4332 [Metschnikowia sp. JCM 33374]|nr:hypothetical protein JCM33374_g4332 [Metschnikowia sp. JCM 33374]